MQQWLSPKILYLEREDWGENPNLPRLGALVLAEDREYAIMHHTVVIDHDATPNLWQTIVEVRRKMQQLQTIRPDLGYDVPYSFVVFFMAGGWIVICEGRGLYRRGAHTKYYNRRGIGVAIQANLELAVDLDPYIGLLSDVWSWLKYDQGLVNLGNVRPPEAQVWGHQQLSPPIDPTACPGSTLMAVIGRIQFANPEEEEQMASFVKEEGSPYVWLVVGNTKVYVPYFDNVRVLHEEGIIRGENLFSSEGYQIVHTVPRGTLATLARLDA